jgi:hypothetical protein
MKEIKDEEKNKKFTSTIKNKMFKGYEKVRNKMQNNFSLENDVFQTFSYNKDLLNLSPYLKKMYSNTNEKNKQKSNNFQYTLDDLTNLNIKHLSKTKKDDYNNILNKLFFTTSHIIKNQKLMNNKKLNIINTNSNIIEDDNNLKEKKIILSKLFPDINEMKKYSNLPFFSLIKVKNPYKMKVNLNSKKEINKKFPQEDFLFKISHNNDADEEKINNNFIKNKGIKKGRTAKYFHGVNNFCINNKVSETNFILDDEIKKEKVKLELDIANMNKGGEKIPQISSKEKRIKLLQKNIKHIKSIPNQIMNDLEDGVFKFIDEEFDNINLSKDKDNSNKKSQEYNINLPTSLSAEADGGSNNRIGHTNIINLNNNFQFDNSLFKNKKLLHTLNYYQKLAKNNSYNNNFTSSGFKRPHKYPINFYSTQQLKQKEHFNKAYKNTFDERNKKKRKGNNSERNSKKLLFDENHNYIKDLQRKLINNNGTAYKRECKIRDMILGNKLKCEFSPVDVKRILNGLKPWVDIKLDEEIDYHFDDINKIKEHNLK